MFSEVEDGDRDISDDNENDVQSDSEKEQDQIKPNIKEMKLFLTLIVMFC